MLVVTDHVLRGDDPWPHENPYGSHVHALNYDAYLDAVQAEAERARGLYDLLVVPGLKLTYNDPDPDLAGHAVAVGLRSFVAMDRGLGEAMAAARRAARRSWPRTRTPANPSSCRPRDASLLA